MKQAAYHAHAPDAHGLGLLSHDSDVRLGQRAAQHRITMAFRFIVVMSHGAPLSEMPGGGSELRYAREMRTFCE